MTTNPNYEAVYAGRENIINDREQAEQASILTNDIEHGVTESESKYNHIYNVYSAIL